MALITLRLAKLSLLTTLLLISLSTSTTAWSEEEDEEFSESISPEKLGLKTEKLTHLHFYIHENLTGAFPSVVRVAEAPGITNKSATLFGAVNVIDDPILVGPERSSKKIGRAQGIGAFASREDFVALLGVTFAFTQGKLNGSSLTMVGRNPLMNKERELPLLGGTGMFRFSRGYVNTTTYLTDFQAGIAILEYHLYVFHF